MTTQSQNERAAQMAQGATQHQLAQRVVQLEDELKQARRLRYTQQAAQSKEEETNADSKDNST